MYRDTASIPATQLVMPLVSRAWNWLKRLGPSLEVEDLQCSFMMYMNDEKQK
jgi:hypothetical protein